MPRFEIRVDVVDRPGAFGTVAVTLGRAGANIVSFEVVDTEQGRAVDHLVVDAEVGADARLRPLLEAVPGVRVEAFRPVARRPAGRGPLDLAEALMAGPPARALEVLVDGLPAALHADWVVALADRSPQPRLLAASVGAPSLVGATPAWLPLHEPGTIGPEGWTPARWRLTPDRASLAVAPLGSRHEAVLAVRAGGPVFRHREVAHLASLARMAARCRRTADRSHPAGARASDRPRLRVAP